LKVVIYTQTDTYQRLTRSGDRAPLACNKCVNKQYDTTRYDGAQPLTFAPKLGKRGTIVLRYYTPSYCILLMLLLVT